MKKLLPACVAATFVLANAWAQDSASVATAATVANAAPQVVAKEGKKEPEKRPKPKPTKKSKKPAPRTSNP